MKHLIVEADGGSRGNPGPAGYGAVVRDPADGEVLAEVAEAIGATTNNVAEYRSLTAGLAAAAEVDPGAAIEIRMDSKLVVEQMSGRWKIKHPDLRPLARQATELASSFAEVAYRWVPRERNAHADRLANAAMDAAAAGEPWKVHAAPREGSGQARPTETESSEGGSVAPGWTAPTTVPTTMVLLRHGETPLSGEKRFSGVGDVELTDTGRAQARAAAARMRAREGIAAIVSSPLARAWETARVIAESMPVPLHTDPDLAETDFGAWEGLTFAEVRDRWPDALSAWLADPEVAPPDGESFAATAERVHRSREKLLSRYPESTVLVVSHVTPIKSLLREALLAPPAALYRMHLDIACVSEVAWYADGPAVVRSLNDLSHLR